MRAIAAALALGLTLASTIVTAAPLAEVKQRGSMSICAHPDALPYAKQRGDVNGFQVDLGRAVAKAIGVGFEARYIIPTHRAKLVDCDLKMDFIVEGFKEESKVMLTQPYARGGIALAVGRGHDEVVGVETVLPGVKIGVMLNSVTSVVLQKRGWMTSPYAFEDDMVDDLIKGDIAAAAISSAKIQYYVHQHPESGIRVVHVYRDEPELGWRLAIGLRRGDAPMLAALNEALERLMADGTMEAIYAKYGIEYRRP